MINNLKLETWSVLNPSIEAEEKSFSEFSYLNAEAKTGNPWVSLLPHVLPMKWYHLLSRIFKDMSLISLYLTWNMCRYPGTSTDRKAAWYRRCDKQEVISIVPCDLLGSPPLVLHLVHRPHGAFHILHTHKTLVQAQVVAYCVLIQRKSEWRRCITGYTLHKSGMTPHWDHTVNYLREGGCDTFQVAALRLK